MVMTFILSGLSGQSIEQQLDSLAASYDLMGSAVLLVRQDTLLLEHYTGKSDLTRNIAISDSTFFRVASISKSVTAIAVMMLVEQQLLDLNTDISTYLGYQVRNPNYLTVPLTIRMLLSHQSSIVDGTGYFSFQQATSQAAPIPDLESLITPAGTHFSANCWRSTEPPWTYFTYANINYGILGTIIEKVSGQRFDQYIRQHILLPLGIQGSFNIQDLPDADRIAALYRKSAGVWVPQADHYAGTLPAPINLSGYLPGTNGMVFSPQGGLRITARELSMIMRLFSNRGIADGIRLLQDTTVDLMKFRHYCYTCGNDGDNMGGLMRGYGLGLHIITNYPNQDIVFPDIEMMGHPGEAYGLLSDMYFDTKGLFGVIFITNGVGTGVQYGTQSVFYACEEAAFRKMFQHYITGQSVEQMQASDITTLLVWPNPSSAGMLNIRIEPAVQEPMLIEIRNLQGALVATHQTQTSEIKIATSTISEGCYLLSVIYEGNRPLRRLITIGK
jgi:CubicO group peptidase (beta-lactamase class C family)